MTVKFKDLCEQDKQEVLNLLEFKRKYLKEKKRKPTGYSKRLKKITDMV